MKIDFHTHTHHSYDSFMKPEKIIKIAKAKGLNGIVICDHNTIKGALEAIKINKDKNFMIIPAAEIATDAGDITGLNIHKEIKEREFLKVAKEIKKQGGFVLLNHPYSHHNLDKIDFSLIDFIEAYNSRLDLELNLKAIELAKKYNKPVLAGSDAHCYNEIGNSYSEIDDIKLFSAVSHKYKKSSFIYVTISQYIKAIKRKDIAVFVSATKILIKNILKKIFTKKAG